MGEGIGAICVGGPVGGKRNHVLYGSRFVLSELQEPIRPWISPLPQPDPLSIDTTYVTQDWKTENGVVQFWVPEGQTHTQTLEILLSAYEAQQRKRHP